MSLTVGQEHASVGDLAGTLSLSQHGGYDYVVVPLVHPLHHRLAHKDRNVALTRTDTILASHEWNSRIVGKISTWLNYDSEVEHVRHNARAAFKQEMAWATHLGLSAVLLPPPKWTCANYASVLNSTLQHVLACSFWVEVPLVSKREQMLRAQLGKSESVEYDLHDDPWECWNRLRTFCQHHMGLHVVLELSADLPSATEIDRWLSEPVAALIVPVDIWLTNAAGFPVLSKAHQNVIKRFLRHNVQAIVRGEARASKGVHVYAQYLRWLEEQLPPLGDGQLFEKPYWDFLQSPLQPLMDNLESQTYETFERDPIKYQKYEEAIEKALKEDAFLQNKDEVVLMVLGAGRGPLVNAAMRAAEKAERKLKLFALEKNPNAVTTLRSRRDNDPRWRNVTVISTDIRHWQPTEKADVIVSELLGSFGDNELSPECLYGAQHILKDGGISIPCNYVSYVAPLSSTKLWGEAGAYKTVKNFETAYVVKFHALAKPCFTFEHPAPAPQNNDRHRSLSFPLEQSALVHGFGGFFDSELYPGVNISINPQSFTTDMFSWFPLYFPLVVPVYVQRNSTLTVDLWRLSNAKQVWLVCGMPNTGKSTLINSLIAGGTKAPNALLPGVMVPGSLDPVQGLKLAVCGLISGSLQPAEFLLFLLNQRESGRNRYRKFLEMSDSDPHAEVFADLLPSLAKRYGKLEVLSQELSARAAGRYTLDDLHDTVDSLQSRTQPEDAHEEL